MEKILTVNNVADILQVKAITVREMFREKRLRGFKVGKAWRTTEAMLQEDIDALARGESPDELPMPESQKARRGVAPTDETMTALDEQGESLENSQQEEARKVTSEASKRPPKDTAKKPQESVESSTPDDDTQQMLF